MCKRFNMRLIDFSYRLWNLASSDGCLTGKCEYINEVGKDIIIMHNMPFHTGMCLVLPIQFH